MKKHPYYSPFRCLPFRYAWRAFLGVALVFAVLGLTSQNARGDDSPSLAQPVRVMQQNLYVGADIFEVVQAAQTDPNTVPLAVLNIYQDIIATDFHVRAEALAEEIQANMPDLISLQEVSTITVFYPGFENFDYLQILLAALADKNLDYYVAGIVDDANVTLPMYAPGVPGNLVYAQLLDHDVILARQSNVVTGNEAHGNYTSTYSFTTPLGTVYFKRGWVAVDATVRGKTYRFVNTHLEVRGGSYQAEQASELINLLKGETLPIILQGDINSSPQDTALVRINKRPYLLLPPYWQFVLAGYADVWPLRILGRSNPGYTCCQEPDLLNETSELTERIDMIFVHNTLGRVPLSFVGPVFAWTIGDTPEDKISNLLPSDHAGVIGHLRIPQLH